MSLAVVKDPICDLTSEAEQTHTIHTSGQYLSVDVLTADSSQQDANLITANWKIFPPSNQTIVDRRILVRYYVEVKSDGGVPIANDLDTCPRQFPVSSIIRNLSCKVNGETISRTLGDLLHAELAYNNSAEDRRRCWSQTCAYPDQFQVLSDWQSAEEGGSARNPAGRYGENPQETLRGAVSYEIVDNGLNDTLRFVITEPLLISPFSSGLKETSGMINVNELYLDLQFDSNSARFMTCGTRQNPPQVSGITTTFYQQPEVIMTYITPSQFQRLPAVQVFNYVQPREYPTPMPLLPAGQSTQVRSNAIRLSQVPKCVMLYCRRQRQVATYDKPDAFLAIKSVRVNWNNQPNILSGATQESLYNMSVANGCNMSYLQWTKKRGSVLNLEFGKQIQLPSGLASGVAGSFTLMIDMEVENVSGEDMLCDFYMVVYDTGTFAVSQNSARASLGVLSPSQVLTAETQDVKVNKHDYHHAQGASSFLESMEHMLPSHHVKHHGGMEKEKAPRVVDGEDKAPRVVGGSLLRRR